MKLMLCNNDSKFSTGIKNILKIIYTFYNITNKVLIVFFFPKKLHLFNISSRNCAFRSFLKKAVPRTGFLLNSKKMCPQYVWK